MTIDPDGIPHLKRHKASPLPDDFPAFEVEVRKRMPERHLLDILKRVHHWTPYTRHFGPPSGSDPKLKEATKRYLFTVFGYGCFLGPNQTARHAPEIINRHRPSYLIAVENGHSHRKLSAAHPNAAEQASAETGQLRSCAVKFIRARVFQSQSGKDTNGVRRSRYLTDPTTSIPRGTHKW